VLASVVQGDADTCNIVYHHIPEGLHDCALKACDAPTRCQNMPQVKVDPVLIYSFRRNKRANRKIF